MSSLQPTRKTAEIAIVPMATTVVSSIDLRRVDTTPTIRAMTLFDGPWETARTWLVASWFLGELLLGTWLLAALVAIQMARRATTPAPCELVDVVVRLSSAMGLSKAPPVFCANTLRDAASIGFFRPWILVPSAWLAQMTPEMLEAVLAHELIHIRRHDLWVNLVQRLAEIVLFFHPAVWWLSRRIREERELCCDAAAVKVTGKRKVYAQTLAHAARQRAAESLLGLATNLGDERMSLLNRVDQLEPHFDKPKVSLHVFVYNSKFYYIIKEGAVGDSVLRMPVTRNETVLDAIALIGGSDPPSERKLWISRPAPSGVAADQVLPIDWSAITRGAKTSTNYQLLPGDRLSVSAPSDATPESANSERIEIQLDQYNRLIGQWRIDEAIDLAKELQGSQSTSEIAKLIGYHADLLQALAPEREPASIKRAKDDAQRQLAFEIWREQKKSEWLVRERLRTRVTLDYNGAPLQQVLRDISSQSDLEISVDQQALARQGVTVRRPISAKLTQEISARSALNLILEPLRLTFERLENGIRVTSTASATDVYMQVYYVGDLITKASKKKDMEAAFHDLIELITSTIATNSWDRVGGPASVVPSYGNLSVVVSQTEEGHAEVGQLVDQLRKLYLDASHHSDDLNDQF